MTVARRTAGPAYANLQWRKQREVWRGRASDAMEIWTRAACRRCALIGSLGSSRWGGEFGGPIAMGRTGVTQRRSNEKRAFQDGARASLVIAGRELAKQKGRTGLSPGIDAGHDVSILITAVEVAGRARGEAPRWNVSMMIMR